MRVEQRQVKDQPLTVIVEYPEYDKSVDNLINKIKNMSISFTGKSIDSSISETDLVRISRTCFMNVSHLKEIMQIKNSHLEAVLDNGEKLIVSRKYLKDIKKIFRRKLL